MNDHKIYKLIMDKNQKGLTLLLDKYGGLIKYIINNIGILSDEDICECISDVLFTIWKRIYKYNKDKASFKTWIVIVARGCAIDYLRKHSKYKQIVYIEDIKESSIVDNNFEALDDNNVVELLQQLPPPDNDIFYRRFVLGETVSKIAKTLGLTSDNVYKRISRGKEKLKILMQKEGYCNV